LTGHGASSTCQSQRGGRKVREHASVRRLHNLARLPWTLITGTMPASTQPPRTTRSTWVAGATFALTALGPDLVAGQVEVACPSGVVARVEILNHSIYGPEAVERAHFPWAYRLANLLHISTRPDRIRAEIVVHEGDCLELNALEESERLVRELAFVARARVTANTEAGGARVVLIETWDEWSTRGGLNLSIENKLRFEGAFASERNLLGRGHYGLVSWRRFQERRDLGTRFGTTSFLGTRLDASVGGGTTRTGQFFNSVFSYPFVGEEGRVAGDVRAIARDHEQAYLTGDTDAYSHVLLPLEDRRFEATLLRRWGEPGSLLLLGGEFRLLRRRVVGTPTAAFANDFNDPLPAPDSFANQLKSQASPPSYARVGVRMGVRNLAFRPHAGIDLVSGVQDIATGTELTLTLGRTFATWDGASLDTYGGVEAFTGLTRGPLTVQTTISAAGRRMDRVAEGGDRIRDLAARADVRLYLYAAAHTLAAELRYRGGWRADEVFQLSMGGDQGVRGFVDLEKPVSRFLVIRFEERWNPRPVGRAVDVGFTVFGDVGRGWAGTAPFSADTGWESAAGVGLRLGLPAGTGSNLRVEIAWPVGGVAEGSVVRAYWVSGSTSRR